MSLIVRRSFEQAAASILRALSAQKISIQFSENDIFDFSCNGTPIFYHSGADTGRNFSATRERIERLGFPTSGKRVLVFLLNDGDTHPDFIRWVNLYCGIRFTVLLCWEESEVITLLASLCRSRSSIGSRPNPSAPPTTGDPVPILLAALTQSPQVVSRPDVIRICNLKPTVRDLLKLSSADIQQLPGIGEKKSVRLETLFNTPFQLKSQPKVVDFAAGPQQEQPGKGLSGILQRLREEEMTEMEGSPTA
ncbi:DNA excision repair protein ERCC-1 [Angomonas deanei]|uniref:Uncharacterized protein n=1 Tax=Angomonas deanei TaxID=59799 RepID=A0A7G2C7G2_9TRYP|nr:DNA excision repair protein ERCC-1 [Angomonas deanei]CAD2214747.1 hypothetical protein, conserved [Angomonas deanei]|eukprot:EPY37486.1 DNA excision repair protein ERCC-1 [Angomonas deanei]